MPKLYTKTGDDGSTGLFGGGRVGKDHPRMEAIGAVDELNAAVGWARNATENATLTEGQAERTEAQRLREGTGQKSEDRVQRSESSDQKSEIRGQKGAMGKPGLPVVGRDVAEAARASEALAHGTPTGLTRFAAILTTLQSRLFDLGADLATPLGSKHEDKVSRISADDVSEAERWIDEVDGGNTPMTQFVLPGGTELAARLHLARTICRRAERRLITLMRAEKGSAAIASAAGAKGVNAQALIYINRISDLLFAMARRANREAGVPDVAWEKKKGQRD
jgi:cob(I)alamin adenosyltransferase